VGRPAGEAPSVSEMRREGERMAGGFGCDLIKFEIFQNRLNSIQTKTDPPMPQKFELKYGWRAFEVRNNFPYKGFIRFEMDFELKIREFSMG
jgi:hypothetical protein